VALGSERVNGKNSGSFYAPTVLIDADDSMLVAFHRSGSIWRREGERLWPRERPHGIEEYLESSTPLWEASQRGISRGR
jgi:hypothetical protein